jgi:uncharacterized lipoprotein YbaY
MRLHNHRPILFLAGLLLLSGCSVPGNISVTPSSTSANSTIQGRVYAGEQPLVGSSIQLYAAGTPATGGGYGLGSTPLITGTLPTTDVNGYFNITGQYTAPTAPSLFYIVASGGSPGSGNPVNPHITLMSAIGGCTATVGLSSSLFININEVTTMGTILALQQFIAPPSAGNLHAPAIGAPATAFNALQNAFESLQNLASISTGAIVTPANNWATTSANGLRINTLADILVYCVNSDPATTTNCSTLFSGASPFSATYPALDTAQAGWYIAQNPTTNIPALFALVPANPPFTALSAAPSDFTVSVATSASACQSPITLGTSADFEILAGSTVTNTGGSVVSDGNLGLSPGTSVTGFPPAILTAPAVMDIADSAAASAQTDLGSAYYIAIALPGAAVLPADISGLTLTPGLYSISSTAQFVTPVTLDAQGDTNAVFIFQIGATLTTAGSAQVILKNGAQAKNIFWAVGTSATLGTSSTFAGNILALTSITLNTSATLQGRALAHNGAVSLDTNTLTNP